MSALGEVREEVASEKGEGVEEEAHQQCGSQLVSFKKQVRGKQWPYIENRQSHLPNNRLIGAPAKIWTILSESERPDGVITESTEKENKDRGSAALWVFGLKRVIERIFLWEGAKNIIAW